MVKERVTKKLLIFLMFLVVLCGLKVNTLAAGNFSISSGTTSLKVGETTTATANANGCGGSFTLSSSDPSVVSIEGSTFEWIENRESFCYIESK